MLFFVQKSAKKYGKNKNSVYLMKKGRDGIWVAKSKKIKNKKKEIEKESEMNVGSHKIETGAEGALMKSCRKRKTEICSVKKDGAAGGCWPADAGMEDVGSRKALSNVKKAAGRALAGQAGKKSLGWHEIVRLVQKMRGGSLTAKQIKLRMSRLFCHVGRRNSLSQLNPAAIAATPAGRYQQYKKRKDKK